MSLLRAVDVPPPRVEPSEGHMRLTALMALLFWFDVLWTAARHTTPAGLSPIAAAAVGCTTQCVFSACEAAAAQRLWSVTGHPVRWHALFSRVLAVSAIEAFAVSVASGGTLLPRNLAVMLAGARALPDGAADAAAPAAFAAFGVLTTFRLLLSAHAQARLARAPLARGLAVVLALYLATRLAMWWTSDLMHGRSFEPWGMLAWPRVVTSA
jgi:hypothetical protein